MEWHEGIEQIREHVVHISTPSGSGTGWMVSTSNATGLCAIATAAHVIDHAHNWELPIRIWNDATGRSRILRAQDRAVHIQPNLDTAAIVFNREELQLPDQALQLMKQDYHLRSGVEVGWLGFPAVQSSGLCFFSGKISNYLEQQHRYLVDGVSIHGVSGGPAFRLLQDSVELIGVVSAYIPNRATGETLPGLGVIQDVAPFHDITERFRSLDEAQSEESPPEEIETEEPSGGDEEA